MSYDSGDLCKKPPGNLQQKLRRWLSISPGLLTKSEKFKFPLLIAVYIWATGCIVGLFIGWIIFRVI